MDKHTTRTEWRDILIAQGRTLRWLADATGTKPRTVYSYSQGKRTPPDEWLERAATALGVEAAA